MSKIVTIGNATLYHGDCREILPSLPKVDLVLTDPPYGILNIADGNCSNQVVRKSARQQGSGVLKNRLLNVSDVQWDVAPDDGFFVWCKDNSETQIYWGGNYFNLPPCRGVLVWDKEQPWENFSQVEIAWTNISRPAAIFKSSATRGTPDKQHPTQKPLALMEWCLNLAPKTTSTVADPFMGSGTTGVACANMGKTFYGIERERKYFDIACERIERAYAQQRLFA